MRAAGATAHQVEVVRMAVEETAAVTKEGVATHAVAPEAEAVAETATAAVATRTRHDTP